MIIVQATSEQEIREQLAQCNFLAVICDESMSCFKDEDAVWMSMEAGHGDASSDFWLYCDASRVVNREFIAFIQANFLEAQGDEGCKVIVHHDERFLLTDIISSGLNGLSSRLWGQLPEQISDVPTFEQEFIWHANEIARGCSSEEVKLLCDAVRQAFRLTAGVAVNNALWFLREEWNRAFDFEKDWRVSAVTPRTFALGVGKKQEFDSFMSIMAMLNRLTLVEPASKKLSSSKAGRGNGYCGGAVFNDSGNIVATYR